MIDTSFPKKEKLCAYSCIQKLFSEGKSVKASPLKMLYIPMKTLCGAPIKILVSVPKRSVRKSAHRNYIKRIIRESYRLQKNIFIKEEGQFALAFIYLAKGKSNFAEIFEAMKQIGNQWSQMDVTDV